MAAKSVSAFVITEGPMLIYNSVASAKLALKYRLASCGFPEFAQAGGLAAYGIDFVDLWSFPRAKRPMVRPSRKARARVQMSS